MITGFPYDEGTRRNGGRIGGAIASNIFRNKLKESTFYLQHPVHIYDCGDIANDMELEKAHIAICDKNKAIYSLAPNAMVFSIGGSNDQSYPNAKALMESYP